MVPDDASGADFVSEHHPEIDLEAEIARVEAELTIYRDVCVPTYTPGPVELAVVENLPAVHRERAEHFIQSDPDWLAAANLLMELVPSVRDRRVISPDEFDRLLVERGAPDDTDASPDYALRGGRIDWRILVFVSFPTLFPTRTMAGLEEEQTAAKDPWDWFRMRASDIAERMLQVPVDEVANDLCFVLPFIADADPTLAKQILDHETWRLRIQANEQLTEQRRSEQLAFLDRILFRFVAHNALLHVLASLANNHFSRIPEFLETDLVDGRYNHLVPRYLFTVLRGKLQVLNQLAFQDADE